MSNVDLEIRADGVGVITLNAPARRNCIDLVTARHIVSACDALHSNAAVGSVVVRATGPAFCSGADRKLLARIAADPASDEAFRDLSAVYEAFACVSRLPVPSIAAVQGTALGAGLNLALSTDVTLVADDARLLSGFLPIGAHPGGGHFTLLTARAGPQTAAALGLFGRSFVGSEAVAAGLAFASCPVHELQGRALELAAVAAADPAMSRLAVECFRLESHAGGWSQAAGSHIERSAQMWSLRRGVVNAAPRPQDSRQ
jgi:enoyl-CoA hydratase